MPINRMSFKMELYTSLNVFDERNGSCMNKIMRAHDFGFTCALTLILLITGG